MKKTFIVFAITALLTVITMTGVACDRAEEGKLPALKVGDRWVYRMVSSSIEYTWTEQVTGEDIVNDKDCWVIGVSIGPSFGNIVDSVLGKFDKATLTEIVVQMAGTWMGVPYTAVTAGYHEFPEAPPWPLEVDKEFRQIATLVTTVTIMSETGPETETETRTEITISEVEKIEEVSVPAGTFKCFKIIEYDETGKRLSTSWYSDKVRNKVKEVDHATGEVMELRSYSL